MQALSPSSRFLVNAFVILTAVSALASAPALAQTAAKATTSAPSVTGMRAFLFQNKTGELSEDVLSAPATPLWNTIAGAKSADATMVVVQVSGPLNAPFNTAARGNARYLLRLVALEGKRATRLLDRTVPIPALTDSGAVYVSFLLRQNGCSNVRLIASIVGPRAAAKPFEQSLSFACGE
jgi:hypothetical protein